MSIDYLGGVRRRWSVVVACVVVATVAGWLTTEVSPPPDRGARTSGVYSATAILLGSAGPSTGIGSLTTLAALTKIGEVPVRVAEALGRSDAADVAAPVTVVADPESGLLTISALARKPKEAETLANEFATQLVAYQRRQIGPTPSGIGVVPGTVQVLEEAEAYPGPPVLNITGDLAGADATEARRASLYIARAGATTLQEDDLRKEILEEGWRLPPRHPLRLSLAAASGFLIGLALAMAMERFDPRLRTRRTAEATMSFPVLTEIPAVKGRGKHPGRVVTDDPYSAPAHGFRVLRAALRSTVDAAGNGSPHVADSIGPHVILISSPGDGEGKTTVAANLAASFAEIGKKAFLMSCDFRNPGLDRVFGVPNEQGVAEGVGGAGTSPVLGGAASVDGTPLRMIPSGKPPRHPGGTLASERMRRAIIEARSAADVVVIDSPSLSTASDAVLLLPYVDAVLLVADATKTTAQQAGVADELLGRLGAPVVGVALNRTRGGRGGRYYYGYRRGRDGKRRGFPSLARHRRAS